MLVRDLEDLPTDLHERERIIVLSTETINQALQTYDDSAFLFDDKVCYIEKPSKEQTAKSKVIAQLYKEGHLKDNTILIANTQESKDISKEVYLPFDILTKKTIQYQLNQFIVLCQLLGAKYIRVSSKELEENHRSRDINVGAKVPKTFNAEVGVHTDFKQKLLAEMEQVHQFQGAEPQLKQAEQLMETGVFDDNISILTLYRTAINLENRSKTVNVKMKFAQEIAKQLKVIADVKAPILKKSIGEATFNTIQEIAQLIEIEYEVHFP